MKTHKTMQETKFYVSVADIGLTPVCTLPGGTEISIVSAATAAEPIWMADAPDEAAITATVFAKIPIWAVSPIFTCEAVS